LALQKPMELDYSTHKIDDVIADDEKLADYIKQARSLWSKAKRVDGLVLRGIGGEKGNDLYVAFEPNQIKSALGESGAFNPKDPDIRSANSPRRVQGMGLSLARRADAMRRPTDLTAQPAADKATVPFKGTPNDGPAALQDLGAEMRNPETGELPKRAG